MSDNVRNEPVGEGDGLWTNGASFQLSPEGQLLPGTDESANHIRQEFVKKAMAQKADAILLDGRRVIDGGYAPEFLEACWHATPADLSWDREATRNLPCPYTGKTRK